MALSPATVPDSTSLPGGTATVSSTDKAKITLRGTQETMLATLYAKVCDAKAGHPILGDEWAARILEHIDYDFAGRTGMDYAVMCAGVALRTRTLDRWTAEFLKKHPRATVLHLACGLDARALRVIEQVGVRKEDYDIRWIDVDLPDVIELRQKLPLPAPPEVDYQLVASSATDSALLDGIPADRPTLVVFEGLSMYLHEDEGKALIQGIARRFPSGEIIFDCFSTLSIWLQRWNPPIRKSGSTLYWGVDSAKPLEELHENLKLVDDLSWAELPGVEEFPMLGRLQMWVVSWIPRLRDVGRLIRFSFGA